MPNISVSVVIPAINEAAIIQRAINSAKTAGAFEIIVVDGGSSDETRELSQSIGARVLNSAPGRAAQQNRGASAASGDVLLFLHADCALSDNCIRQIQSAAETNGKRRSDHGAFRQVIDDASLIYRWIEWGNGLRIEWMSMPFGDQGIWVRRELFESVGQFANVKLMEDVKLSEQLRSRSRPRLLDGPIHVGARRWRKSGPIRQTIRNWELMIRYKMGVSPDRLFESYPQHDA